MSTRERLPQQHGGPGDVLTAGPAVLPGARAADPDRPLGGVRVGGSVDDDDAPRDVVDLLTLDAFVTGREPFARSLWLENVAADAPLKADGGRLAREAVDEWCVSRLWVGDGWSLLTVRWTDTRKVRLVATALTAEHARRLVDEVSAGAVVVEPPAPQSVPIGFWHLGAHGARRMNRRIDATAWEDLRVNYTRRTADAMDTLMAWTADDVRGRLLLLHGPPGTGKTTLLRTLARHWRSWCQVDCVLDPERLFAMPAYLLEVALGAGGEDEDGDERWRLLVLEDCDELIRAEAKSSAGQALSRLLNLTDGMLGQGRKVLVAVTTNEDLSRLHPAVTRPGRSLARLEVGRLTPAEAAAWLGGQVPPSLQRDGATLAELFALREGAPAVSVEPEPVGFGTYL